MIKEMEKALKRYLKGKNRITMGVVVAFLLGSSFAFGDVTIKYENSTLIVQDDLGTNIGTVTKNPAGEFTWTIPEGTDITKTVKIDDTVNTNNIKINIVNNGNISGSSTGGDKSGNGIFSYSDTSSSIIGNITNSGTISGNSTGGYRSKSGNGIFSYSDTSSSIIGNITNSGIISGSTTGNGTHLGNGIFSRSNKSTIGDIINNGIISGNVSGSENGNGIYSSSYSFDSFPESKIGKITNYGIISGNNTGSNTVNGIYSSSSTTSSFTKSKIGKITNYGIISGNDSGNKSGNGIYLYSSSGSSIIESISNTGVIMGNGNGIYIVGNSNSGITDYKNYGLVIGQTPVKIEGGGTAINKPEREGMAITLESDGSIKTNGITSGTGSSTGIYSIINTELKNSRKDAYDNFEGIQNNKIINGAGVASGTVTIEAGKNFSLNGGIINAYKTAVTVKDGASFTSTDVTINGGGLDRTTPVISGSTGANTVNISGNSFINGDIDLDAGDDTLNFSSAVSRAVGNDNINLFHKISNVENININQKVTAFETSEITGAKDINIGKNGEFVLRIDGTNSNKHALSNGNSSGTIDSDGGKLLLALNGVSDGSTIDMGIKLGDGIYGVENPDIEYRDLFTLDTTSYLHSIRKTPGSSTITVETKSTLPLSPTTPEYTNYGKLNKIYQSMRVVDGVKEFNVDTDEKFSSFMGYLNDIYAGNPYSYSSELSIKSMGMFRDIVTENSFKADTGKWMIYGGLTHIDGGTKDTYYGKGYYTYDIGSSDIDSDTKITGAYMLGEYGVSDDFKAGVAVGGNKFKSDLSNGSKVDGDALYIGGYAKKYLGNLKVTAGMGFQYGDYDANRTAAGREITETRSYSSSYNDLTYDIYLNGRYSHNIGDNLYLEPYATLSYTYVKQDGADEGNKTLAIETDSQSFDYTVGKMGIDLKKVIPHEKGKSTLSVGASYTRLLNGADEEYITGRFKGGSDFDILVAHKNEHSLGLNAKYALELENGILFDVKGTYSVERDSHNQSGKNKTKGEWIVGTGLGYKF
ncbi:autotransporter [Fusobacterium varium]|nr:autotransporter [Fusobacterium varium]